MGKGIVMKKLWLISILFLTNLTQGYGAAETADIQRLIDFCIRQERLFSIRIEYTFSASGPNVEKIDEGDLRFVGEQSYLLIAERPFNKKFLLLQAQQLEDFQKKLYEFFSWKVYHNGIYKEVQISDQKNSLVGLIAETPPLGTNINLTPLGFTIFHECLGAEGRSLSDLLRTKDPNLVFLLDPAERRINDCNSIKLTCRKKWLSNSMVNLMDIYFSLDHDYSILRIAYYNADGITVEYNVQKFQAVGDGLWIPTECEIRGRQGDINKISVVEVQVNLPVEENVFDLDFPPGTKVYDTIREKQYTIKPTQEQLDSVLEAP